MRDVKFSCMHARIYEILQFESCIVLYNKACNIDRRATRATRDSALWACGAAGDSELLGTAMPRRVYHLETQSSKETSSRTGVRCP